MASFLKQFSLTIIFALGAFSCADGINTSHLEPETGSALTEESAVSNWWQPRADDNLRWYWQLQGEIDTSHSVAVYDIDIDCLLYTSPSPRDRG